MIIHILCELFIIISYLCGMEFNTYVSTSVKGVGCELLGYEGTDDRVMESCTVVKE